MRVHKIKSLFGLFHRSSLGCILAAKSWSTCIYKNWSCLKKLEKDFWVDPDVIWTRSLLIWSQTRYRCATESVVQQGCKSESSWSAWFLSCIHDPMFTGYLYNCHLSNVLRDPLSKVETFDNTYRAGIGRGPIYACLACIESLSGTPCEKGTMQEQAKSKLFPKLLKKFRAWQDSNLQSPDPKSGALSIRPHTLGEEKESAQWYIFPYFNLACNSQMSYQNTDDEIGMLQENVEQRGAVSLGEMIFFTAQGVSVAPFKEMLVRSSGDCGWG